MMEVEDGETIWVGGCEVAAVLYGLFDLCWREDVCVMIEWVLFAYVFEDESCLWVCMMGDWSSELIAAVSCYCLWFCVCMAMEGDWLVRILMWAFS